MSRLSLRHASSSVSALEAMSGLGAISTVVSWWLVATGNIIAREGGFVKWGPWGFVLHCWGA